jgi:hypothetical protein
MMSRRETRTLTLVSKSRQLATALNSAMSESAHRQKKNVSRTYNERIGLAEEGVSRGAAWGVRVVFAILLAGIRGLVEENR